MPDANRDLLAALQNPAIYAHPVDHVEMLETHISWVLLCGDYAYKIKKPLDLGFLNFSTLEKRRYYCQEELRLNTRLALEIYLAVVAITGSLKHPAIDAPGPVIDYAVKMRRFEQQNLFINRLRAGTLTTGLLDQLALLVANFHGQSPSAGLDTPFGTPETILTPVMENFQQIGEAVDPSTQSRLEWLQQWSTAKHRSLTAVFLQRRKAGHIRECHGDLHLGNIVAFRGQATPFDGIEFNASLRWIDVISDMAFLVMDLDDHHRSDLAFRVLNAYLERTGDYAGLVLLRFYLVYRALVRAKVAGIRLQQAGETPELVTELRNYLDLANAYSKPPEPRLILCHGLSGSGKTTVSQKLLEALPAIRIRSDVERKRLHRLQPEQRSESGLDQGLYAEQATHRTYSRLMQLAGTVIDAGFSVIVDATFLRQKQRRPFIEMAREKRIPLHIVHCQASINTLQQRIVKREKAGRDASEASLAVLQRQMRSREELTVEELQNCLAVDTDNPADIDALLRFLNTSPAG